MAAALLQIISEILQPNVNYIVPADELQIYVN
jgi:hypothetical protein